MFFNLIFSAILALSQCTYSEGSINPGSYVAAVVEFRPATDGNGTAEDLPELVRINIHNANQIIQNASQYGADIIVFPEFALTSLASNASHILKNATEYRKYYRDVASRIPNPEDNIILCNTNSTYAKSLQSISCLAQQYKIYVVVSHHERVDCPNCDCASDGFLLYNTNVVFDRKGTLIARYRKYNLLHEPGTNVTRKPEISTFTTDFGVTFGQLTGLDLLMEEPSKYFMNNPNVTDIVFSSRLFKELPFTDPVQDQAAWAYAADVNLLAAGYNINVNGSGGSGIYAGKRGPVVTYRTGNLGTALLVATVHSLNKRNRPHDVADGGIVILNGELLRLFDDIADRGGSVDSKLDNILDNSNSLEYNTYRIWPFEYNADIHAQTLCVDEFCCMIDLKFKSDPVMFLNNNDFISYRYMMYAINAPKYKLSDGREIGLEFCGLVACTKMDPYTCGLKFDQNNTDLVTSTIFEYVKLSAYGSKGRHRRAPYATTNDYLLHSGTDFSFVNYGQVNSSNTVMFTERPIDDIMLFAIVGRNFEKEDPVKSMASTSLVSVTVMVFFMVIARFYDVIGVH